MIKSFQLARLPKIYFGPCKLSELPGIVKSTGDTVILVTGMHSFSRTEYAQNLFLQLKNLGITVQTVTISGEPSVEMIDEAVKRFTDETVSVVIGIGGGSVLDAGKAISAMLYKTGSVMDFLEGVGTKKHPGTKVPYIAVPTTSGTGSEATKNAVISGTGENRFKKSLRHDNFVPDFAVVDPVLTLNCPRNVTLACGMDCFVQLTEAYLSTGSNAYMDVLALEGVRSVESSLVRCLNDGDDLEARTGMSFAALTSGICLANAGLGVIHGFASVLGGMYEIPHGVACGTLMSISNEINVRELRKNSGDRGALKKYARLGRIFLKDEGKTEDFYIDGFINYLHHLTDDFRLPGLKQFGIKENDLVKICAATAVKSNPVGLTADDLLEIISNRFF